VKKEKRHREKQAEEGYRGAKKLRKNKRKFLSRKGVG